MQLSLRNFLNASSIRPSCLSLGTCPRRRFPLTRPAAVDGASSSPGADQATGSSSSTVQTHTAPVPSAETPEHPCEACTAPSQAQPGAEDEPQTLLARVKRFFTGSKLDKARLASLGFGAFSAYGVISNINAGILITIAWLTVVRTTGLTPLDGGNWSRFLAVYAGLWIGSNFLRPIRLTLALAAAPFFDTAIGWVARRTGLAKVPAFVVMLLCIAVVTTSLLAATIAVLGGFPPGCRMPWQLA